MYWLCPHPQDCILHWIHGMQINYNYSYKYYILVLKKCKVGNTESTKLFLLFLLMFNMAAKSDGGVVVLAFIQSWTRGAWFKAQMIYWLSQLRFLISPPIFPVSCRNSNFKYATIISYQILTCSPLIIACAFHLMLYDSYR
jgi:hypothetical protein